MPFLQARDLTVAYDEVGTGPKPVVFIHGHWASKRWWQLVLQRIPRAYRGIAFDLRGCGQTRGFDRGYTMPEQAADLRAFLTGLGLERATLVGHSLGAAIAMQFAVESPQRVDALVLLGSVPADGVQLDYNFYLQVPWLKASRPYLSEALGMMMPGLAKGPFREALIDDGFGLSYGAAIGNHQAAAHWNIVAQLPKLHVPTLIVRGDHD
jgi:pimeloyl-ACP methyl ester carboxylesterase